MATLSFFEYQIPYKKPFSISSVSYQNRSGIIAAWQTQTGTVYAEAAPLAPFSKETLTDCIHYISTQPNSVIQAVTSESSSAALPYPSLRFMCDTLRVQHIAMKSGCNNLASFLGSNLSSVLCNATIGIGSLADTISAVSKAWDAGFRCIKLKVGKEPESELLAISKIRALFPEIDIRLDANGAWITGDAVQFLKKCSPYAISYCEQPLPAGMETHFPEVETDSGVPVAADESIRTISDCNYLLEHELCTVLILKPMLIGSISELRKIAEKAVKSTTQLVITTALDSGISRHITAQLAAIFGSNTHHGLATGTLFSHDVFDDSLFLRNGSYIFPKFSDITIKNVPQPFLTLDL